MKVSFQQLGKTLDGAFVVHIGLNGYFTFSPPLFKWCPSFGGPIFLFPFGAPLLLSKSSHRVSMGVCSCCEGFRSLDTNFNLFKDHCFFTGFSSSRFILAMLKFFDGVLIRNIFGFFFRHVQDDIHPFDLPFNLSAFRHGIQTTLGFI